MSKMKIDEVEKITDIEIDKPINTTKSTIKNQVKSATTKSKQQVQDQSVNISIDKSPSANKSKNQAKSQIISELEDFDNVQNTLITSKSTEINIENKSKVSNKQIKNQIIDSNIETSLDNALQEKTNIEPLNEFNNQISAQKQNNSTMLEFSNESTDYNQRLNLKVENLQKKNTSIETQLVKKTEDKPSVINSNTQIASKSVKVHKKGMHGLAIFGITLLSLIIIIAIAFLIFAYSMSSSINIHSGIYIKNIEVSELDKDTATDSISSYIYNRIPEEIVLIHGDYEATLDSKELNIKFNIDDAVNTAYNIGRSNNIFLDGFEILSTMINNKNVDPSFSLDDEILTNMLNDISNKLPDRVIESGYYIEDNNLIINKGAKGVVIDVAKTKKTIKEQIQNLNVLNNKIEISTLPASPTILDIEKIYEETHKDAIDATFTMEPRSVTPSENGIDFSISLDEAKDMMNNNEQECVIPLKVVYPNVTTNMIGSEAFPDVLSNFSTYYAASNYNRTTNLRLAANKINGTVLMPDEVFSYNTVVGERTIAAGYKEAPIYVSGRVEDGLGGGICQIATTLYNAAVYANLDIVERANHQFVPSYVGAGRDATVVYGSIDFKFKNNRNYPIKIICSVEGGVANFQILGLKTDNDYDVEIYSRITSQTANATNSETYKILKQNGNVIDQTILSRDYYKRH